MILSITVKSLPNVSYDDIERSIKESESVKEDADKLRVSAEIGDINESLNLKVQELIRSKNKELSKEK